MRGVYYMTVCHGAVTCINACTPFRYQSESDTFHSIIYRQSDLEKSSISGAACGSAKEELHKKLSILQRSVIRDEPTIAKRDLEKRQATRNTTHVRCWLNIIGDYKFYSELTSASGSQADRMAQAMSLLSTIVSTASMIYERTDFNNDNVPDGIHFGILNTDIQVIPPVTGDFFANEFIGVEAFLNQHSTANYEEYCLSYRFTYRDFDDGVLGLAYIGAQPGAGGGAGMCGCTDGV